MIVKGKDAATAKRLIAEAKKQGLPASVVKVADEGFDVPDTVAEPPKPKPEPKPEPKAEEPTAPTSTRSRRSRSKKE